ncbi:MAG: hypothetical protein C0448_16260, partial [Sphingobacteriaceae bacterium]|nr:hypothetical protein [Sphingobacteriaceae bacterium]
YQNAQLQSTEPYQNEFRNATVADLNYIEGNLYFYLREDYAHSGIVKERDYKKFRVVYKDGSLIPPGAVPPPSSSNMASGGNRIAYSISTNNVTYAPINATASNPLTYSQNNGDWQAYNLYGKANVKQAAPGNYVDTNTITVYF